MDQLAELTAGLNDGQHTLAIESATKVCTALDQVSRIAVAIVVGYGREERSRARMASVDLDTISRRAMRQLGRMQSTLDSPVVHRLITRLVVTAAPMMSGIHTMETRDGASS